MTDIENSIENAEVTNEVVESKSITSILDGGSRDSEDDSDNDKKEVKEVVNDDESIAESEQEEKKEATEAEEELKPETDIEKLQKNLKETQSWGHAKAREAKEISKKLEALEIQLQEYVESGALTPDEGDVVLKHAAHNRPQEEPIPLTKEQEIEHILNQTFPQVVKFNTDPDIHKYGEAFYHMTQNISIEDLQKLTDDLDRVKKDPVLMTKNAIKIGRQYYNDFYREYKESGGVHGLTRNYRNKLSDQQKTIDRLKKDVVKLQQNSDYTDTAGYSIPSGSSGKANTVRNRSLDGIFGRAKLGKI